MVLQHSPISVQVDRLGLDKEPPGPVPQLPAGPHDDQHRNAQVIGEEGRRAGLSRDGVDGGVPVAQQDEEHGCEAKQRGPGVAQLPVAVGLLGDDVAALDLLRDSPPPVGDEDGHPEDEEAGAGQRREPAKDLGSRVGDVEEAEAHADDRCQDERRDGPPHAVHPAEESRRHSVG